MITRMNHASVYVLDQDSAYDFYINKLGFKVNTDAPMGPGARWLTVSPPEQPDFEIALLHVAPGMIFTEETAGIMRDLVQRGTFGFGVFECVDIYATYEELKAKGVEFSHPPEVQPYGINTVFKDDSGNWFSLGQRE